MIFGLEVRLWWVIAGGLLLAVLLVFQVLQGMRIIKFKGPLFMKVHRTTAWVILGGAVLHGTLALAYFLG